jgi:hypothetical protein
MAGRIAEVVAVTVFATIVTLIIAAPVLRAPSERVFGMPVVGRHHDPFTVMQQFGRPVSIGPYFQPVTDVTGALLARITGPVAAYNWLVLLSFPLSAAAAYLLARALAISRAAAAIAAMAYAFSPFHLAHAAYHIHIAQTQWLPLYLFAVWRCLDRVSLPALGLLAAATLAVTLSNFYGGLIAAVLTPVAVTAYYFVSSRANPGSARRLGITVAMLCLLAATATAYAVYAAGAVVANSATFAFPREDLFRYSARWWSYLVPPAEHPALGVFARAVWTRAGLRDGLLEEQVSLGWGMVGLAIVAVIAWFASGRARPARPLALVPVLFLVAAAALVCSLSPDQRIGPLAVIRPAALLYSVVPMFRSYARFGVAVQLMVALLASIGVEVLLRAGTARARVACLALLLLAVGEYIVRPSAMWRDTLPAMGHRWVMQQADRGHVLDCTPVNQGSAAVPWLTGGRIELLGGPITDCTDGSVSRALIANRYTHLLVGRDTADGEWFADHPAPDGLTIAASFTDGQVFAVAAQPPTIHTAAMAGFWPREHDHEWTWRWMASQQASWTIVNSTTRSVGANLDLELSAFHHARRLELFLDGGRLQTVVVEPSRHTYRVGPLTVWPGYHELVFRPAEDATVASDVLDTDDTRQLSLAFGAWNWNVQDEQP